jgi:hypothetical protein
MGDERIRIIDHKKILLTNDEFTAYQNLCREYDRPNFKGEALFQDHFETNDEGIILFVRPPSKKYSSLEVFCFLISLQVNQHLRVSQNQVDSLVREATIKYKEMIADLESKNKILEEKLKVVEAV